MSFVCFIVLKKSEMYQCRLITADYFNLCKRLTIIRFSLTPFLTTVLLFLGF